MHCFCDGRFCRHILPTNGAYLVKNVTVAVFPETDAAGNTLADHHNFYTSVSDFLQDILRFLIVKDRSGTENL